MTLRNRAKAALLGLVMIGLPTYLIDYQTGFSAHITVLAGVVAAWMFGYAAHGVDLDEETRDETAE